MAIREFKFIRYTHQQDCRKCLEGNTISNPVNTGVTRMCGDYDIPFYILSGGQYIAEVAQGKIRYSLLGW